MLSHYVEFDKDMKIKNLDTPEEKKYMYVLVIYTHIYVRKHVVKYV